MIYYIIHTFMNPSDEKLAEMTKQLKQADMLRDEFVSLVSHDLRSPMTTIKSYSWMVLHGKAGAITPKATEYLNRIYTSTERLIRLVNEMLDVSRIESGHVTIRKAPLDIPHLLREVQTEFQTMAAQSHISLTVAESTNIPPVRADADKIHLVLDNLVGNALKFTAKNGSVTMGVSQIDGYVEIRITDTGQGIHAEDIPLLFKKFGRLEHSLVAMRGNSTGLGLYISKQYVELHGGKIWVTSLPDKGSTFTFTLPV